MLQVSTCGRSAPSAASEWIKPQLFNDERRFCFEILAFVWCLNSDFFTTLRHELLVHRGTAFVPHAVHERGAARVHGFKADMHSTCVTWPHKTSRMSLWNE